MWRARSKLFAGLVLACLHINAAWAAQPPDPSPMATTLIALQVDAEKPVAVRSRFQESPPVIMVDFPSRRVIASLPEQSLIAKGVVRSITARYESGRPQAPRYLRSLHIALSASYTYRVRSTSSRILIEIDHPASVGTASVQVALAGGTILGAAAPPRTSDRFRAMQEALARATPVPWTMQIDLTPPAQPPPAEPIAAPRRPAQRPPETAPEPGQAAAPLRLARPPSGAAIVMLALLLAAAAWVWVVGRGSVFGSWARRAPSAAQRLPASLGLIDQLVWRAFERQGYQLVAELPSTHVAGTFRIIQKDGVKSALAVVGHSPFLEKRTVEQVARAMHGANLDQGLLVASGAVTVPAQRTAKTYHLGLIGREQLIELLGVGAAGEYVAAQLERQQAQLQEAMGTLKAYTEELETLRRQRNEASWYLGEERARAAGLEAQFNDVNQQLHHYKTELERWQQEALTFRKQWEENEWYLGESREHARHLEAQVAGLQEAAQRTEAAERQRQEAEWYLGEERVKREALEQRCRQLEEELATSRRQEVVLGKALEQLKQQFAGFRAHGERRVAPRAKVQDAFIELLNGSDHPMFTGAVRDVSATGIGLQTDRELLEAIRMRLHLPGRAPIESRAKIMWQRALQEPPGYCSGFCFTSLPDEARTALHAMTEG